MGQVDIIGGKKELQIGDALATLCAARDITDRKYPFSQEGRVSLLGVFGKSRFIDVVCPSDSDLGCGPD